MDLVGKSLQFKHAKQEVGGKTESENSKPGSRCVVKAIHVDPNPVLGWFLKTVPAEKW